MKAVRIRSLVTLGAGGSVFRMSAASQIAPKGPHWRSCLHLSESSVEKYVNSIFSKLGLADERSVSRRVAAVLAYLRDTGRGSTTDPTFKPENG